MLDFPAAFISEWIPAFAGMTATFQRFHEFIHNLSGRIPKTAFPTGRKIGGGNCRFFPAGRKSRQNSFDNAFGLFVASRMRPCVNALKEAEVMTDN
jgi:hypothetical protein